MIRILTFLLMLLQLGYSESERSKIHGTWESDKAATMEYLNHYAKLDEHQKKVMPLLFGRAVVTYNPDGTGVMKIAAARLPKVDGGEIVLEAIEEKIEFKVIGESDLQVVLEFKGDDPNFPGYRFAIMKFHDADTYSILLSDSQFDINGREYFRRVRKTDD